MTFSLSLQFTHEVFSSQPNSFLAIILQLSIQFSSSAPKLISRQTGVAQLDATQLTQTMFFVSLKPLGTDDAEHSLSIEKACLLIRCLAMDVVLLRAYGSAGMCLPSRCLVMNLYNTTFMSFDWIHMIQNSVQ
jgi:hypothetical protein